ncbi:MAG: bifunctional oligoribonuclease/PAP phosphatase NrnA [Muribaculaceae bacterium]|nr:bifunctional oligoribonuclease/PAP phosphatase NrnA [Muribaculaceae bacterium]
MTISRIIDDNTVAAAKNLIEASSNVVITCHKTPDGDALGSSLGLAAVLTATGRHVTVITPDTPPKNLMFLPGADRVLIASRFTDKAKSILADADLLFCLDYNSLMRIDRLQPLVEQCHAPRIMIDHHLDPEPIADVMVSYPKESSTCMVLYRLLMQMGWADRINSDAAACIYTGMLTDTGNFSYNSNNPDIYLVIANLLSTGINKDDIYNKVWNTNSANRLRICGYSLYRKMQLFPDHSLALITLSREELNEFDYVKGDTESLVNRPLSIPGIVWSVYLREDEPGFVKVSTRSTGSFPVNTFCERLFGGGGHINAAGGEFHGSLSDAIATVLNAAPDYDPYLTSNT